MVVVVVVEGEVEKGKINHVAGCKITIESKRAEEKDRLEIEFEEWKENQSE